MFRFNRFRGAALAAALVIAPTAGKAQEVAPLEPLVNARETAPTEDPIATPLNNVSFEEEIDLSTVSLTDFNRLQDPETIPTDNGEDEIGPDDVVVTGERAPIVPEVPKFTEHGFNAAALRVFDDYLSIRGDSTTWSVGDGGNLFEFRWRWDDTDGEREGYADRTPTDEDEEPDYFGRRY